MFLIVEKTVFCWLAAYKPYQWKKWSSRRAAKLFNCHTTSPSTTQRLHTNIKKSIPPHKKGQNIPPPGFNHKDQSSAVQQFWFEIIFTFFYYFASMIYAVAKCHNQIRWVVGVSEVCDQNVDRVSKKDKSSVTRCGNLSPFWWFSECFGDFFFQKSPKIDALM